MNRTIRLTIGFVPAVALWMIAFIGERLEVYAGRAFFRLRDWMDVPR